MKQDYKDFLGWVVTTNGDPWRLETEEDVDNFVQGRGYRFISDQLPKDYDGIWDIMCRLDLDHTPKSADESWHLDYVEFEDGERAYMCIEAYSNLHPHKKRDAIIIVDRDDADEFFLIVDKERGTEINRFSTSDFGTFRFDPDYREEEVLSQIAERCNINIVSKIYWF